MLHGSDGERQVTRDALGEEFERDTIDAAAAGSTWSGMIDAAIQAETERVISEIGEAHGPRA